MAYVENLGALRTFEAQLDQVQTDGPGGGAITPARIAGAHKLYGEVSEMTTPELALQFMDFADNRPVFGAFPEPFDYGLTITKWDPQITGLLGHYVYFTVRTDVVTSLKNDSEDLASATFEGFVFSVASVTVTRDNTTVPAKQINVRVHKMVTPIGGTDFDYDYEEKKLVRNGVDYFATYRTNLNYPG